MIIISRWHDYYDIGRSFGYDPQDVRYVRERKPIYYDRLKWEELCFRATPGIRKFDQSPHGTNKINYVWINPFLVVFCGKVYTGTQIIEAVPSSGPFRDYIKTYWYNYESFKQYLSKYQRLNWDWVNGSRWSTFKYSSFLGNIYDTESFRQKCIDEKVTILYSEPEHPADEERLVLNRELKNIDFQKVIPPYQAYQEIDMWVSGVLPQPDRPMLTVSDEVKIHKRGFDKWSFRKEGKKK